MIKIICDRCGKRIINGYEGVIELPELDEDYILRDGEKFKYEICAKCLGKLYDFFEYATKHVYEEADA